MSPRKSHGTMLRTSERSVLNRCRQSWAWSYGEGLKPVLESPPLRFGTLIHAALEVYYSTGTRLHREHPAAVFERLYAEEVERTTREIPDWRDEDDVWHSHLELGVAMLEGYVERWLEQDKEYVTLATEQTFQYPIIVPPGEEPLSPSAPCIYVGTFDRVLYHRPTKRLLLGDYKTTKNDPTKTKYLQLDEQAGAYWAYGPPWLSTSAPTALKAQIRRRVRALPPSVRKSVLDSEGNLKFDGILYDFLAKKLPDERPTNAAGQCLNQNGSISKTQPGARYHRELVFRDEHDRAEVIKRIYEDAVEIGMLRTGDLVVKKSPDRWHCFGGETRILTSSGIRRLDELTHKLTRVLNRHGQWEGATVHSFGKQQLMRIELDDGSVIRATPEHRWWKMKPDSPGRLFAWTQTDKRITTLELDVVPIVAAPIPSVSDEGIRHGFVYGDGYLKRGMACAYFQKPHKTFMEEYFEDEKDRIREGTTANRRRIEGLPPHYKDLPVRINPSYARGFITGLFAADGSVGQQGGCSISCEGRDKAELIAEIARLGGCVISSVRLLSDKPTNYSPVGTVTRELMNIQIKPATIPVLRSEHVARLKKTNQTRRMYREVVSIEYDDVEEVFCAVVPGSESFTLANGVATSNCSMCSFVDACELHECGQDYRAYLKATTHYADPYSAHGTAESEHEWGQPVSNKL